VLDVLETIRLNFTTGRVFMAEDFLRENSQPAIDGFAKVLHGISVDYKPHVELKRRVPSAIGLIRTGDTLQYANMILESA
jgi:D-ribose pyranase